MRTKRSHKLIPLFLVVFAITFLNVSQNISEIHAALNFSNASVYFPGIKKVTLEAGGELIYCFTPKCDDTYWFTALVPGELYLTDDGLLEPQMTIYDQNYNVMVEYPDLIMPGNTHMIDLKKNETVYLVVSNRFPTRGGTFDFVGEADYCYENGHLWDAGVVTEEPTETKEGVRTYTCSRCGAEKNEKISQLINKTKDENRNHQADEKEVISPSSTGVSVREKEIKVSNITIKKNNNEKKEASKNPAKVQGLRLSRKSPGTICITWKRQSVTGYQVQYALNKKFTKKKKSKYIKKTSYTFKKLKKKKIYYFRVRAYKLNGKKKIYGKWSTVNKVKIRK